MKLPAFLLSFVLLLCACKSVYIERMPQADFTGIKRYYVEHRLTDDHHLDDLIVAELQSRGFEASAGPLTMMPDDAQAVVSYVDDWAWDFKSYLIQLRIDIRRARTGQPLATSTYRQPSPITKPPPQVVRTIFTQLLGKS